MECLNCGNEINATDKFCKKCGQENQVLRCKNCNFISYEDIDFCPDCGKDDFEPVSAEKARNEYWEGYVKELSKYI